MSIVCHNIRVARNLISKFVTFGGYLIWIPIN